MSHTEKHGHAQSTEQSRGRSIASRSSSKNFGEGAALTHSDTDFTSPSLSPPSLPSNALSLPLNVLHRTARSLSPDLALVPPLPCLSGSLLFSSERISPKPHLTSNSASPASSAHLGPPPTTLTPMARLGPLEPGEGPVKQFRKHFLRGDRAETGGKRGRCSVLARTCRGQPETS